MSRSEPPPPRGVDTEGFIGQICHVKTEDHICTVGANDLHGHDVGHLATKSDPDVNTGYKGPTRIRGVNAVAAPCPG